MKSRREARDDLGLHASERPGIPIPERGNVEIEIINVDYRIGWDGNDTYRVVFQVTARLEGETEGTTGYTADHTFDDEDIAMHFAEGFVEELTGG